MVQLKINSLIEKGNKKATNKTYAVKSKVGIKMGNFGHLVEFQIRMDNEFLTNNSDVHAGAVDYANPIGFQTVDHAFTKSDNVHRAGHGIGQ